MDKQLLYLRIGFLRTPLMLLAFCTVSALSSVVSLDAQTIVVPSPTIVGESPLQTNLASDGVNWRDRRAVLEHQFGEELIKIGAWCRKNGIGQQVEQTFKLKQNRDPDRQYIFLPSTAKMPAIPEGILGQWLEKITTAKQAHANRIFELAKEASAAEEGAVAYQLLHEVIYHDRDHTAVRTMLGHKRKDDGNWQIGPRQSVRVSVPSRVHKMMGWPAKSFTRVETPHFVIDSTASEASTRLLAKKLERWYLVWRQVFFEYWSSNTRLKRWLDGKAAQKFTKRKFNVVFFRNKEDYVNELTRLGVVGIQASTGYYSNSNKTSFFYDGGLAEQATWRHELTHQLFREPRRTRTSKTFENAYFWVDEGIACYFESLNDYEGLVTLGGFDAQRSQFARLRCFLEGFYINLSDFSAIGQTAWQRRADKGRLYSQSAGLSDMLMNDKGGRHQKKFIEFLKLVYKGQGRVRANAFEKVLGTKYNTLDARYKEFLKVTNEELEKFLTKPKLRTELSVTGTKPRSVGYQAIAKCVNLRWIDLSGSQVTKRNLEKLQACKNLDEIIMTECRFDNDAFSALEGFPKLNKVMLSGSLVQNHHLASFRNLRTVTILHLASTRITDPGLDFLATMPNLRELHLNNAKVSAQGIAALKAKKPSLVVYK